jgi:iron-sulfur cluster assembly accessory protein
VELNFKKGVDDPALQRMLRLSVVPGGCSGFQYSFELEEHANVETEDAVFEKAGARVVVDDASLALLAGATIDFEEEVRASVSYGDWRLLAFRPRVCCAHGVRALCSADDEIRLCRRRQSAVQRGVRMRHFLPSEGFLSCRSREQRGRGACACHAM